MTRQQVRHRWHRWRLVWWPLLRSCFPPPPPGAIWHYWSGECTGYGCTDPRWHG